jgi:hypothetical protein
MYKMTAITLKIIFGIQTARRGVNPTLIAATDVICIENM